jgi:RNA polymerase sigma-70 factor (ECF subfamily)
MSVKRSIVKSPDPSVESPDFIRRLLSRDQAAFRALVKRYHARLLGFAGSIAGERLAEEIVQEAWMSAWRALPGFEGRAALKTWLYTIVRNECTARLRKEQRVQTVSIDEELHEDGIDAWFAANFVQNGHWQGGIAAWTMDTPEQLLEEEQLRDCLEHNIASLQAMQRSVFMLRDLEQLSLEEICNILGLSDSNVRVLLHRARLKLLQVINHYQETGEC